MTEYKTIERIEYLEQEIEFIKNNILVIKEALKDKIYAPAPKPKPVVEGWITEGWNGSKRLYLYDDSFNSYDLPEIKLRYDPNKTGVESVEVLEVREV